ncbi:hypothetical protein HDU97_005102 [Phlyctochytrium planicorne]|nr:hypothetical protein HDU97_005102 [Phlyctochytrium planicorne]
MFTLILTSDFQAVLRTPGLLFKDRIGIALRFLPDDALSDFVRQEIEIHIASGELEGLCLTGFGDRGGLLLQEYVDRTGDVQTVACLPGRFLRGVGGRVELWIEE